jgi:hypothetical protein
LNLQLQQEEAMRIASLTTGLLISVASVMSASAEVRAPTPGADAPLLGDKASYPLLRYDYAPSPDGKAFTLIYSDLVATVNACNAKPVPGHTEPIHTTNPVVPQVSTVVLPLRSAGPVKLPFIVQGYAITGSGGQATLLINVNGQTKTIQFPASTDRSFLETLDYSSPYVAELRVTFVLLAECDAYLSVDAVDSDMAAAGKRKVTKPKQ